MTISPAMHRGALRRACWPLLIAALLAAAAALGAVDAPPPLSGAASGERLGCYAAAFDPQAAGFTPLREVRCNEALRFPLASAFKSFVLLEVAKRVDAGTLRWNQSIPIPRENRSLDDGPPLPRQMRLRQLAQKMIWQSNNTAADTCFKLVGLGAPSATLVAWNLPDIRVVMPTREFWLALSGLTPRHFPYAQLPPAASAYAGLPRDQQLAVVESVRRDGAGLGVGRIDRAVTDFYDFRTYDPETAFGVLDALDNSAAPADMVRYLYRLFHASGLSPAAADTLRQLMPNGDGQVDRKHIRPPLTYWGGKGGSDLGAENSAGYGITTRGSHILYAVMTSHYRDEEAAAEAVNTQLTRVFDMLDAE